MATPKSSEAFRTISEASAELDVPQHVLRHWEEVFGQIRPMRRAGGRRYYRPVDLDLLRGVRVLLYDERYTTKGVQKILKSQGAKFVAEIGRRAGAGEPLDLRPALDLEGADKDTRAQDNPFRRQSSGATDQRRPARPRPDPATRAALQRVLTRLVAVRAAVDEASETLERAAGDEA
ncbi:MAG: MerR family transcriptional regulator [Pseudomonadota bacterium]